MTTHSKPPNKKVLLIYANHEKAPQPPAKYIDRLERALQTAGAEVERLDLNTPPDILLDHLEAGALPVVIKKTTDGHH